jgi:Flp pilus assembly protein TadG
MLNKARKPRSGATAVEFAFVVPVVLMLIFGIFEYGRLMCVQQITENAARTGARFAVVNTNDPNMVTDTQAVVDNAMCGLQSQLGAGYARNVFLANASGTNIGNPTTAVFGQYIGVQITGTFSCAPTTFLGLGSTLPISSTAIMCSEAN